MCSCHTAHATQKSVQHNNHLLLQGGKESEGVYVCGGKLCLVFWDHMLRGLCSKFVSFLAKIASKFCPAFYEREGSGE